MKDMTGDITDVYGVILDMNGKIKYIKDCLYKRVLRYLI